jgi:hypothetical protein
MWEGYCGLLRLQLQSFDSINMCDKDDINSTIADTILGLNLGVKFEKYITDINYLNLERFVT